MLTGQEILVCNQAMIEKIETILSGDCRLDPHRPIVVGVSGGPDSLCLLDLIRRAGYQVVVSHFNHKLRPEAEMEAKAVEETARKLSVPFVTESADVHLYAKNEGLSIEEAARHLRYRFLFTQANRFQAQAVAVGHTADDQVETVLMHFLRGAGLNGLKGMTFRRVLPIYDAELPLVRPLLNMWRAETVAYCVSQNLHPHYDPSNDSSDYFRNRLRNTLIPILETYNPRVREAIWRSAQTLSTDQALLTEALAAWWMQAVIEETSDYVKLDLKFLSGHDEGLQRQLVRRAIEHILPSQEIIYSVLESASAFIKDARRSRMDLIGGLVLFREANVLYISKPDAKLPLDLWPQMPIEMNSINITPPAQMFLSGGWQFSSKEWQPADTAWEKSSMNEDPFQVWLDDESVFGDLELRVRRPGDKFEPLGLNGHTQKLSDFFTNVKLPQRARARWPLLCSGEAVIWVPGYRPAEPYKLKKTSRASIYFAISHTPVKN
jgi:tRNA(Ile)-lysidine synthase